MVAFTGNFFDYNAFSPREELRLACQRTYSEKLNHPFSLKGRVICLLRVFTHSASIVLKPLHYLATTIGLLVTVHFFGKEASLNKLKEILKKKPNEEIAEMIDTYENNPELLQRESEKAKDKFFTVITAPFSQVIQIFKAALGVIYPGFYFKNDELIPYIKELATIAKQVDCSPDLIERLERGSMIIHKSLNDCPNREYYYAQFQRDIAFICNKFSDPQFPSSRKHALLSMLNPHPKGSGIESCTPGLGRILQQIRINIDIPEDPQIVIPWLVDQIQGELINVMVMQADTTKGQQDCPEWHTTIRQMALTPGHKGNAMILTMGDSIGLSEEMMDQAKKDISAIRIEALSPEELEGLLQAFKTLLKEAGLVKSLMAQINSQPDGSPGLKTFRNHMTRVLADKVAKDHPENEDPSTTAIKLYYLHGGEGDPLDESFSDLNEEGVRAFVATLSSRE